MLKNIRPTLLLPLTLTSFLTGSCNYLAPRVDCVTNQQFSKETDKSNYSKPFRYTSNPLTIHIRELKSNPGGTYALIDQGGVFEDSYKYAIDMKALMESKQLSAVAEEWKQQQVCDPTTGSLTTNEALIKDSLEELTRNAGLPELIAKDPAKATMLAYLLNNEYPSHKIIKTKDGWLSFGEIIGKRLDNQGMLIATIDAYRSARHEIINAEKLLRRLRLDNIKYDYIGRASDNLKRHIDLLKSYNRKPIK